MKILDQNDVKIQNSILPKFEISIFQHLTTSKNTKSAPQNFKLNCDLEFLIQRSIFLNPKSISPIPLESCFGT